MNTPQNTNTLSWDDCTSMESVRHIMPSQLRPRTR